MRRVAGAGVPAVLLHRVTLLLPAATSWERRCAGHLRVRGAADRLHMACWKDGRWTIPGLLVKARDITCEVTGGRLLLRVETLPAERQTIVDGELFQEIADHNWTLEDGKGGARLLTIELEKAAGLVGQMRWLSLTR